MSLAQCHRQLPAIKEKNNLTNQLRQFIQIMSYTIHMNNDRISEEAHGDIFSFLTEHETLTELGLDGLSDDIFQFDIPIVGTCDMMKLTGKLKIDI